VRCSRRRAHFGGRSADGKTQGIFARRQLEHGDCLSQRTLRRRHTTQLCNFGADVIAGAVDAAGGLAFFSDPNAESAIEGDTPSIWVILESVVGVGVRSILALDACLVIFHKFRRRCLVVAFAILR
jgi:hypothetical protein